MTPIAVAVLSLSLSADAFAAAIGRGAQHRPRFVEALKTGAIFGLIEAVTPVIGWGVGLVAAGLVERIDHWIAFVLLAGVGGRMIWEARHEREEETGVAGAVKRGGMLALVATAVGTSIDAAAVGVSLAFLGSHIWQVALGVGLTTFILATLGLLIGRQAGAKLGLWAERIGGVLLIGLGTKILLEHLGVIGF
ncbi:MAG: manganese efflux pump [Brevundimonas sp.]|nr:MAG: manganese efflux pump [Brevundimonas sp.]